eukprot:XP_020397881.1 putative laccase family protein isoform X2 [Zea mays]
MTSPSSSSSWLLLLLSCLALALLAADAEVHHHEFVVQETPVKRLCKTHNVITVNGQYPGPTLEVREGDTLVINVVNRAQYNVTIHWHGIRQMRTGWADGPEFVTQCPIRPGGSYKYRFTIEGQEGTLWWHAHSSWLRATVYGALIIRPRENKTYPFAKPSREVPVILGEWWDANPIDVIREAQRTGGAPNVSDAFTINGQPGDLYKCSQKEHTIHSMLLSSSAPPPASARRDYGHPGEARRDGASAVHQRRAQPRAVRHHRAAQDDGGRHRRVLHQALHHLGAHGRAGTDHRRPRHHGPGARPVLRRRARLRLRAERGVRQHHHHGGRRVRLRLRLRLRPQDPAGVPVPPGLQRHRRRRRLRRGDQEPRQGQGPRERRRAPLLHRRPRPVQLRAGPALRRAQQQHPLHGQHEQRLLRLPADRLPPPRALLQDPRRLHHRLPGAPAGAVRLHGAERQPGPVAAGPRDQAVPAQVRLRGAARPAGHQHRHAREPPHPHPWLRFLHPR